MTENKQETGEESWREKTGLAEDTRRVVFYVSDDRKQELKQEADDQNLSLSQYAQKLVGKARAYEQTGEPEASDQQGQRVEELETKIERLEEELKRERQKNQGRQEIDDPTVVKKFVTAEPKSLEEIVREIVESGCLNEFIASRVENRLYYLASQDEVKFDRIQDGWRIPPNEVN